MKSKYLIFQEVLAELENELGWEGDMQELLVTSELYLKADELLDKENITEFKVY